MTGTVPEDQYTFSTISRLILLRIRNVWEKIVDRIKKTHFRFGNIFQKVVPFKRLRKKSTVESDRPQMAT